MLTRVASVGDARLVPLAADHARGFAARLGLPAADSEALGRRVDEAVRFAFAHAYPDGAVGQLEVTLEAVQAGIRVTVHDWGRPMRSGGGELGPLPDGLSELGQRVEDLRLLNLGGDGKRLSFHYPVQVPEVDEPGVDVPPLATRAGGREAAIEIRDGRADDAEEIAQLLYASYGLRYLHPRFYQPRWLGPELAAGRVLSTVAVHQTATGETVIGHEALLPVPGSPAAENGVAAVLPDYRGLGLLGRMGDRTMARAREVGLATVFARAVTNHPYSQLAERAHGFGECALCLGALPPAMDMRSLPDDAPRGRTALLVLAKPLVARTRRSVLPSRYSERLEATYDRLRLSRGEPADRAAPTGPALSVTQEPEAKAADVTVADWSPETPAELHRMVRRLLAEHVDAIYADVDLEAGLEVEAAVDALNGLGFSYAGLWPDGVQGHDHLRLQRLNSSDVELEGIVCASPEAEQLRDFVLADLAQVAERA